MSDEGALSLDLRGVAVTDLNGHTLGRVARVRPEGYNVVLSRRAEARFGIHEIVVPRELVVNVDDHDVTLCEESQYVVHPEWRPRVEIGE